MLDLLDAHFAQHRFLFGERPTLGDFGLVGSMYGHLGRDPGRRANWWRRAGTCVPGSTAWPSRPTVRRACLLCWRTTRSRPRWRRYFRPLPGSSSRCSKASTRR
ncbi:MAG: glutathione S-transferase C-terminal domain-containing protein [Comamonadaceae bacterium]|nr:glutathione S-transferase C-terminal domain-containing protein [Comamonadaceae bacterium]